MCSPFGKPDTSAADAAASEQEQQYAQEKQDIQLKLQQIDESEISSLNAPSDLSVGTTPTTGAL